MPAPVPDLPPRQRRDTHPQNGIEAELQEILQELLEVKPIGIRDDFFALGGHSLLAMRLAAAVEKRWQTTISVRSVFENPTIEQIAKFIQRGQNDREFSGIIRLQPNGTRSPLLLVHGAGGGMLWGYRNLVRHLGEDQPVLAFQSQGLQGEPEPESIEALAATYVAELRRFRPHGPYYLGGYCFGGLVAYEMARRLEQAHQRVLLWNYRRRCL